MRDLGKTIVKILYMLGIIGMTGMLYASSVNVTLSDKNVTIGEEVELRISVQGDDFEEPQISSLCGSQIHSRSTQSAFNFVSSSKSTKTKTYSYGFIAQKECSIPSLKIKVDGEEFVTSALHLSVHKPTQSTNDAFVMSMKSSKSEVYVGEEFDLSVLIRQKNGTRFVDTKLQEPSFEAFVVKGRTPVQKTADNNYIEHKFTYKLKAQREGSVEIIPARLSVASRDSSRDSWGMFMQRLKWKNYFSNALQIEVKKLPQGVDLIGNFRINVDVDKKILSANEAVNLNINIEGEGNLEEILSMKPYIAGVNIFAQDPIVKEGKFTQKIAFVSDGNFTIEPFILTFFNPLTKKIEKIESDKIFIEVKNAHKKEKLVLKKADKTIVQKEDVKPVKTQELSLWQLFLAFFGGIFVGITLLLLYFKRESIAKINFTSEGNKELIVKLLPFVHHEEVREFIDDLEQKTYGNVEGRVNKKALKALLKRYEIS